MVKISQEPHACYELLSNEPAMNDFTSIITYYEKVRNTQASRALSKASYKNLYERAVEVVKYNQWMMGRIGEVNKQVKLIVDSPDRPEDFVEQHVDDEIFDSLDKGYVNISKAVMKYQIEKDPTPLKQIKKLAKIILFKDQSDTQIAIMVTANHTIADGATLYSIYRLLDRKLPLVTLKREGVSNFMTQIAEHTSIISGGQKVKKAADEKGVKRREKNLLALFNEPIDRWMMSCVWAGLKNIFRKKVEINTFVYEVKNAEVEKLKNMYAQFPGTEFVSTNDILTSWFANTHKSMETLFMAVNLRNRIPNITDDHAGNYLQLALFDRENIRTPAKVREYLQKLLKPGFDWKPPSSKVMNRYPTSMHTNWVGFYHHIQLEGYNQELHLPVFTPEPYTERICGLTFANSANMITFRPYPGHTAVMIVNGLVKEITADFLEAEQILGCKIIGV